MLSVPLRQVHGLTVFPRTQSKRCWVKSLFCWYLRLRKIQYPHRPLPELVKSLTSAIPESLENVLPPRRERMRPSSLNGKDPRKNSYKVYIKSVQLLVLENFPIHAVLNVTSPQKLKTRRSIVLYMLYSSSSKHKGR